MNQNLDSTKYEPLRYIENFLKEESLKKFEDTFYENIVNPSMIINKGEGYIEYYKDSYEDGEDFKPVRVKFIDTLIIKLKAQASLSFNFLEERKKEFEYNDKNHTPFTLKQLTKVETLKRSIPESYNYKSQILSELTILEGKIKDLIGDIPVRVTKKINFSSTTPFFDPKISIKDLSKLYDLAIDLDIIDDEAISESTFLNVFITNNPKTLEDRIIFKVDNQKATYFLNLISIYFNNLTHSKISKSEAFINKNNKVFTQKYLDTAKYRYQKKLTEKEFERIKKAVDRFK